MTQRSPAADFEVSTRDAIEDELAAVPDVHVMPNVDLIAHVESYLCFCQPRLDYINRHTDCRVYVHRDLQAEKH